MLPLLSDGREKKELCTPLAFYFYRGIPSGIPRRHMQFGDLEIRFRFMACQHRNVSTLMPACTHTRSPQKLGCACLSHHATVICTSLLRTCHGYQEAFCTHLPTIWAWKWVTKTIQMKMTQLFVHEAFAKILPSLLPPNPTTGCFLALHSIVFP